MPETMSDNILLRLTLAQAHSVDDALKAWQPPRDPVPSEMSLARLVSFVVRMYEDAESAYAEGVIRAVKDGSLTLSELHSERQAFEEMFRIGAEVADRLLGYLDSITSMMGRPISCAEQLRGTAQRFNELQSRLAAEWPVCGPEEIQQMLGEREREQGMEPADAFAEIAGVDRAAWLERVAEHKRKHRRDG